MSTRKPGFAEVLSTAASRTERMLEVCLPPEAGDRGEAELAAAMRYAVLGGGKRLRAFLTLDVAALFGADASGSERVAAAVECLHAYSLVHDDMPCMDDDDLRRGKPTVHKGRRVMREWSAGRRSTLPPRARRPRWDLPR
jgi:farnesyl diphosphate synthase